MLFSWQEYILEGDFASPVIMILYMSEDDMIESGCTFVCLKCYGDLCNKSVWLDFYADWSFNCALKNKGSCF